MSQVFSDVLGEIKRRARGQWVHLFEQAGMNGSHFRKVNRPCPLCGGRDRFSFYPKSEDGYWFCRGCGHGDGIDLIRQYRHETFWQTLIFLGRALNVEVSPKQGGPHRKTDDVTSRVIDDLWEHAITLKTLTATNPVLSYLAHRGIALSDELLQRDVLRFSPLLDYWEKEDDTVVAHEAWPAMLARLTDLEDHLINVHRTYLRVDGAKAPVNSPKKLCRGPIKGGWIQLYEPGRTLGVAEGIETALSAAQLFGVPTWSAVCLNGFQNVDTLPTCVEHLVIFGDNDASYSGQAAAWQLAQTWHRLYPEKQVTIKIPEQQGWDWNDVLLRH